MRYITFIFLTIISSLVFISCEDEGQAYAGAVELVSDKDYDDCDGDEDEFTIHHVTFYNDSMHILVDYGGGCGEADFDLLAKESYTAAAPTTRELKLCLDKDDDCEALLQREVSFDLTPIQESGQDSLLINLHGFDETVTYHY